MFQSLRKRRRSMGSCISSRSLALSTFTTSNLTRERWYRNRISGETVFVTTEHEATNGVVGVNKKSQVLSVSIDEATVIPYILGTLRNAELAFTLASQADLPGANYHYFKQSQARFQNGHDVKDFAILVQGHLTNCTDQRGH